MYKKYRDIYNPTLRACKKLHFSTAISNNAKNLKKTWSILNAALHNPKQHNTIHSLLHNNSPITNPLTIANTFNTFFTNIAADIATNIHPTNTHHTQHNNLTHPSTPPFSMSDTLVSEVEQTNIIKCLEDKKNS